MSLLHNPYFYEFNIRLGQFKIACLVNENLYVRGNETLSVPHDHQECELRYFESGTACYTVGDMQNVCEAGDYLLIPPGVYHAQLALDKNGKETAQFNLRFHLSPPKPSAPVTAKTAAARADIVEYLAHPHFCHAESNTIGVLLNQIAQAMQHQRTGYLFSIKALCQALFVEILRPVAEKANLVVFPDEKMSCGRYTRSAIDDFFRYRYLGPVTVQDFASDMRVSVRQASRIMQDVYGMSFSHKLKEMRVKAAKVMLSTTDKNIAEIAASCGFETYSNFFISFKQQEKISPENYRLLHRGSGVL